jgi:hypothetical protein
LERNTLNKVDVKITNALLTKEFLSVSIFKLTIFGMQHIKDIDIMKNIYKYLEDTGG